jgi:hypothetical protein
MPYGDSTDVIIVALRARPKALFVDSVPTIGERIILSPENNSLIRFTPGVDEESDSPVVTRAALRRGKFTPSRTEEVSGLRSMSWDRVRNQMLYGIVERGTCKIRTSDGAFEAYLRVPNCAQLFDNPSVAHPFAVSPEGNYVVIPDNGLDGAYLLRCRPTG